MTEYTCIAPGCCDQRQDHGKVEDHECLPRQVRDSSYLCPGCQGRLERHIAEMPALHDELVLSLASARRKSQDRGKSDSSGLDLEPRVVKAREHVLTLVQSWSRIVSEERGMRLPLGETVAALSTWLLRHHDWLVHQPYADEVSGNFAETWAEAMACRQMVPARKIQIRLHDGTPAACTEKAEGPRLPLDEDGPMCPGSVEAIVRDADSMLPSQINCSTDPRHIWPADQWRTIGQKFINQQTRRFVGQLDNPTAA